MLLLRRVGSWLGAAGGGLPVAWGAYIVQGALSCERGPVGLEWCSTTHLALQWGVLLAVLGALGLLGAGLARRHPGRAAVIMLGADVLPLLLVLESGSAEPVRLVPLVLLAGGIASAASAMANARQNRPVA